MLSLNSWCRVQFCLINVSLGIYDLFCNIDPVTYYVFSIYVLVLQYCLNNFIFSDVWSETRYLYFYLAGVLFAGNHSYFCCLDIFRVVGIQKSFIGIESVSSLIYVTFIYISIRCSFFLHHSQL